MGAVRNVGVLGQGNSEFYDVEGSRTLNTSRIGEWKERSGKKRRKENKKNKWLRVNEFLNPFTFNSGEGRYIHSGRRTLKD